MSPTQIQAQYATPTGIIRIMPFPAPAVDTSVQPTQAIAPHEVIVESRPTVANRVKALAMDVNDFINEHIGIVMLAIGALLGFLLVVVFTKKGAALASAVKG